VRLIFLDIDGVANTPETWSGMRHTDALDDALVARVAALVRETGARVVLSSAWRKVYGRAATVAGLVRHGWPDAAEHVFDETPERWGEPRGAEIGGWLNAWHLDSSRPRVARYVILDDDVDAGWSHDPKHFVHVYYAEGLSEADCARAREELLRP